ncbi:hypothetical protein [Iodidimonas gelatinilytica]|uniref:hypothetical protein n=1 Tax=Iodidimonas gelatinilytica TaxID=1236966 RepID=UPI001230873C|nr:hypothetical protein [Iodidimonas gelatinilytica]
MAYPLAIGRTAGLCLNTLDIWFIEICRRIRLHGEGDRLIAKTGTSKAPRVDAKTQKGVVGDPWAPVNVKDRKSLTLGPSKLDYHHICDWLFGGNWQAPAMIRKADMSDTNQNWALIIQALGRGNCKTYGYHERTLVLPRQSAARLITDAQALHTLSQDLIKDIGELKKILGHAIAIAAIDGRSTSPDKDKYAAAKPWQDGLDLMADRHFFPALWDMLPAYLHKDYAAQDEAKHRFFRRLIKEAQTLLNTAIETVSAAQFHLRARSRAERVFRARIGKHFDWYFSNDNKEANDAAA